MFTFILEHSPIFYFMQSFWRDEAFSALFAAKPLVWIIQNSSFDPPLYYILLHFWELLFGQSEIAVRSLSLFGFILSTYLVMLIAEKLFIKKWHQWFVTLLFFFNPMLLYYAFEARAYGWYIFFATLTIYGYIKKDWKLFIIGGILGFYNHLYSLLVPAICTLHYITLETKNFFDKKTILKNPITRSVLIIAAAILPWFIRFLFVADKFAYSWYFAVDFHLIQSVLGNMYTGYEGTPWYLWSVTKWISVAVLLLSTFAMIPKTHRKHAALFLGFVYIPLISIIGISFIKPLFVNRYVIPVTIAEIFIIGYAITSFKREGVQRIAALCIFIMTLGFTFWYSDQHSKMDLKTPLNEINTLANEQDRIFADDPLIFLETLYYAKNRSHVYFYNPSGAVFPWFIGDALLEPNHIVTEFPPYPSRTFVVHRDGTYSIMYTLPLTYNKKRAL
ncbi:MAG: hypothetical protein WAV51_04200 [Microgenomates group bacterium]